jgi:uncharacterized protein YndB with AHSA1/START domain
MKIHKSIRVERSPEVSFRIFCEEIGQWWPGGFGGEGSRLTIEPKVGGSFFETRTDGTKYEIGRVTAYQPPVVVAFTWRAPSWDITTQVEIRFSPEDTATRIVLEHTGWEQSPKLTESRKNYDNGWETILGHYQRHISAPSA